MWVARASRVRPLRELFASRRPGFGRSEHRGFRHVSRRGRCPGPRLATGQLSYLGRNRSWRHGGDLSCAARALAAHRCLETSAELSQRFSGDPDAISTRSQSSRQPRSSEYPAHLRRRRDRRRASIFQHEIRPRWKFARFQGELSRFATACRPIDRNGRASHRSRSPAGNSSPRSQTRKYSARCARRADSDAPKLRSVIPSVSRDLETICARCLERDPNLRYQSAGALAQELERWLEGRPIAARPVSPPARLYRWSRRNPILATSLAVCLFFGTAVVTRQVQNWKLGNKLRENELTKNSIAVLPFLDLDSATEESNWTATVARALQTELSEIGNARVVPVGKAEDLKMAARNFRTRSALFGTRRKTDRGIQISVQLFDPDGEPLFGRIVRSEERRVGKEG